MKIKKASVRVLTFIPCDPGWCPRKYRKAQTSVQSRWNGNRHTTGMIRLLVLYIWTAPSLSWTNTSCFPMLHAGP